MTLPSEGALQSIWEATTTRPAPPAIPGNLDTDICVIGAGIAGVSAAYELLRAGREVVLIDDGVPGGGETGRTTAHMLVASATPLEAA